MTRDKRDKRDWQRDMAECEFFRNRTTSFLPDIGIYWLQEAAAEKDRADAAEAREQRLKEARPIEEWHEEIGDVLLWEFPICEPPYCGTPLDFDGPVYYTHWTPIVVPEAVVPRPKAIEPTAIPSVSGGRSGFDTKEGE